jgi:two-component system response regulator AtoC
MASKQRVLVADDKENMRRLVARILEDTFEVEEAEDGARALALVATRPYDVIVTDIRMPAADGFELLAATKARDPSTEVVLMTGYATVPDAVRAMKLGAFDYLEKPFDPDAALTVVARAAERRRLAVAARLAAAPGEEDSFHALVGRSPAMRAVYRLLEKAAAVDATVLIGGETGTGKELAARAIHSLSARRERRFVPVNCGALPAELVESELFGHARGAFTGASAARAGLFQEAQGGTIFLDEVGELPLAAQVKLNRVLQEKEVRRVGETQATPVDVRVVAATHRDLREEVRAGRFREDLFYRLNVFTVALPPLRDRVEDVPLLAAHFLDKHARALRRTLRGFAPEALARLAAHGWPGNVRELENVVERAVAVAGGELVEAGDLPPELSAGTAPAPPAPGAALAALPYKDAVAGARDRVTREYLVALMTEFGGNVTRAAERAGVERESLHRLLRKHGLRSEDFKAE